MLLLLNNDVEFLSQTRAELVANAFALVLVGAQLHYQMEPFSMGVIMGLGGIAGCV